MFFSHRVSPAASTIVAYVLLCDSSLISEASPIIQEPWDTHNGKEPKNQASDGDTRYNVVRLNRHIFTENVHRAEMPATTEHWFVFFCADWFEPCQALLPHFRESGELEEGDLNDGQLLTRHVRFARVDCAVDKPLCNSEGVEAYPTIVHYTGGRRVAQWTANGRNDEKRFMKWLDRRLVQDTSTVATHTASSAAASQLAARVAPSEYIANFAMVVVLAALNFLAIRQQVNADSLNEKQGVAPLAPDGSIPTAARGVARLLPPAWAGERAGRMEL